MGLGMLRGRIALEDTRSAEECAAKVSEVVKNVAAGDWILGNGWNQERWNSSELPDTSLLDAVAPDNPVVLYRVDTHAAWLNRRALELAAITPRQIPGGSVELDAQGQPSGILIDNAISLVDRVMPQPTLEQKVRWIESAVEECLRYGITEVHDMNVEPERLESMARVADRGGMHIRCQVFLQAQDDQWRTVGDPHTLAPSVDIVGVKYFADGALGSRGALLLEPYSDAPDHYGLELMGTDELVERASAALERRYAVATHAIGDAACRLTLDAYQQLRDRHPRALLRMEHAQTVHPDDQPRFAELDVVPTMQAVHCTSDAHMAERRLGADRCGYAYPWRSLAATGVPILGGSDFPVETPDPLVGMRAYHFREATSDGIPWHPEETLSRTEALRAYTTNAPAGIPRVQKILRGRLRPSHDADLVVLNADPFVDSDARVLMTIVEGRIRYRSEG
jgi:predicted amidohydrolase YtcJ